MTELLQIISNRKLNNILYEAFSVNEPKEFSDYLFYNQKVKYYQDKLNELGISEYINLVKYNDGYIRRFRFIFKPNLLYEEYEIVMSILKLYNII